MRIVSAVPVLCFHLLSLAQTGLHRDPEGFSLQLPAGWNVRKSGAGQVTATSADGGQFIHIAPLLGRSASCVDTLRGRLMQGWALFPAAAPAAPQPAGRGLAVADVRFRSGQSRGAILCAETGPRSGMLYAFASPVDRFLPDRPSLIAILRSFRYEGSGGGSPAASALPMEPWREASENAFTSVKPAGWQVQGGIMRISNMDVRSGYRLVRPDGRAAMIIGDVRLNKCTIPAQQTIMAPLGQGNDWCPYRDGVQVAEFYAQNAIAQDWGVQNLRVVERRPRPDLSAQADQQIAAYNSLGFRHNYGDLILEGVRQGQPLTIRISGMSRLLPSIDPTLLGGNFTQAVSGFLAPKGEESAIGSALGQVIGSMQWNPQWLGANMAAASRDAESIRRFMAWQSDMGRQIFEERSASAQRRSDAVGDLLAGQVRLKDAEGNLYHAKAGSNYYFADDVAARTGRPDTTPITGSDVWVPLVNGVIDLRPLEVIR